MTHGNGNGNGCTSMPDDKRTRLAKCRQCMFCTTSLIRWVCTVSGGTTHDLISGKVVAAAHYVYALDLIGYPSCLDVNLGECRHFRPPE